MKILDNICMLLMLQFCETYTARDMDKLLSLFTQNATMFGTGIDEYRTGLKEIEEQVERDWAQSEKGELKLVNMLSPSKNSTWAAANFTAHIQINGKVHTFEPLRGTVIIEKEDDQWKIAHMHASFPDNLQSQGQSFPSQ